MDNRFIAAYLRISDDDGDLGERKRESNSIENQRKLIEAYVEKHEELSKCPLKEFVDDGRSGINFNRPGIQTLFNEIKKNKVQCIIVKDLSRFGRNYIEVGDYIEQAFPSLGIRFISIADNFDSFKNLAGIEIGTKNLIHDLYSRDLSQKIKSTKALMQKQGDYSGGGIPFGYLGNSENGKPVSYIIDLGAAQIVKKIFALASDGNPTAKIAEILNKEGIPTPETYKRKHAGIHSQAEHSKKKLWTSPQVASIIQNEVYTGTYVSHKYSAVHPGIVKKLDESQYIKFEAHHEGFIEQNIFQTAQKAIVAAKKRKKYNSSKHLSPFAGKIKCGHCKYAMSFKPSTKNPYYYCRMGNSCGSHVKIESGLLENTVWNVMQKFMEIYHNKKNATQEGQSHLLPTVPKVKEEKRALQIKAGHCTIHRLELYAQWKEGQLTKDEYIAKKNESYMSEAGYAKELGQLNQHMCGMVSTQDQAEQKNALVIFSETQDLTRPLIDEWVERIEVYSNNRIEIRWKIKNFIPTDNEPCSRACADIWRMPRG